MKNKGKEIDTDIFIEISVHLKVVRTMLVTIQLKAKVKSATISTEENKKHLKNVGPIRHCEPPLHCHSPGVATVARQL